MNEIQKRIWLAPFPCPSQLATAYGVIKGACVALVEDLPPESAKRLAEIFEMLGANKLNLPNE